MEEAAAAAALPRRRQRQRQRERVIQLMNKNTLSWIEPWSLRNFQLKVQQLRWGVPVLALPKTGLWCLILASGVNMEVKVDTLLDSVLKEALG
ncbi:hypothetical protein HGM15179_014851 [Zosterops borbonicus]|uniref:Uncharacterized protein n=1 Tax=Zosterops borbonicus TaxID=364589 RepID=A0A8K1G5F0_9PASS|nr:hypothetical protein HGM15179_014851 [Zosterops borbonicus]